MTDSLPSSADLAAFLPEIVLLLGACAVLFVPMLLPRQKLLAVPVAAAGATAAAFLMLFYVRATAIHTPGGHFGGLLLLDPFAWAIKALLIAFAAVVLALWLTDSHDKLITDGQSEHVPVFFCMLLCATLGLCLMASTAHLLTIFLAMEIAALPSYVLVAFRKVHPSAGRAAVKYAFVGLACSAFMIFGVSLLYGLSSSLDLGEIAAALNRHLAPATPAPALAGTSALALLLVLLGAGGKLAIFPLHFWCADVLEGTAIDAATFLSVAPVTAGMALLLRILALLTAASPLLAAWLTPAILLLGAVTCLCGSLGALPQTNIRRLLAWQGIAQTGYMLMGMAVLVSPVRDHAASAAPGDLLASPAADMLLSYLFIYLFMTGGAFAAAAAIAQRLTGPAEAGMSLGVDRVISPASAPHRASATGDDIRQYADLSRRAPILAATMLVFLASLAGLPLTVGFAARIKLFASLLNLPAPLGWISVLVIAANTVIGAYSCLRVVRQMYFTQSAAPRLIEIAPVTIVALVLAVPNVALFIGYGWVDRQAERHGQLLAPLPPVPAPAVAQ